MIGREAKMIRSLNSRNRAESRMMKFLRYCAEQLQRPGNKYPATRLEKAMVEARKILDAAKKLRPKKVKCFRCEASLDIQKSALYIAGVSHVARSPENSASATGEAFAQTGKGRMYIGAGMIELPLCLDCGAILDTLAEAQAVRIPTLEEFEAEVLAIRRTKR